MEPYRTTGTEKTIGDIIEEKRAEIGRREGYRRRDLESLRTAIEDGVGDAKIERVRERAFRDAALYSAMSARPTTEYEIRMGESVLSYRHRTVHIRREQRLRYLAYGYLRGKKRSEVENKVVHELRSVDESLLLLTIREHQPAQPPEELDAVLAWLAEGRS